MKPRVAVVRFPGVNCEEETLRAVRRAGLEGEIFGWTRPPAELRAFEAYVLPGGFSWQDRVRAGALAAKDPMVRVVAEESAARAKPVLGICNGAQVLIEAGLVPGGRGVELALARNRMPGRTGYYARWIHVRVEPSSCVFTRTLTAGTVLPLPMAHAEGRFTARTAGRLEDLARAGQVPLRYSSPEGREASGFPENPNGSDADAAAVCDRRGLVLALMPHPERAQELGQLARGVPGGWAGRRERAAEQGDERDAAGPGLALFEGLRRHLEDA